MWAFLVRVLALWLGLGTAVLAGGPILDLGYAKYEGYYNTSSDVNTWNGIYYAQSPTGERRWRPPLDIELNNDYSSQGFINATGFGPQCVQGIPPASGKATFPPVGTEDCLLLNIQLPAHPQSNPLPVLLQIHGGGYVKTNADGNPADFLIKQSNGSIAYVSVQYRLGAFGFLSSSEIKENGAANVGLLDQRAAIQWTQRNARAFGGDPSKITLTGGSAGGGSVMSQMILYGGVSNPPFRAVIAEYPWWQPFKNDTTLETQYRLLLNAAGCYDLACLRSLSTEALANATQMVYINAYLAPGGYGYGDFYFGPSVDGKVIRDLPSNEFKQGHFTKVPLLVDRDGYEGVSFSNRSMGNSTAEQVTDLLTIFPSAKQSFIDRLYEVYPASAYNSTFYQRAQWFGDAIIECPTYYMASAVADYGLPAYKLMFYAGSEVHGAAFPYLYASNNEGTYMANDTIGTYMKDWYLSFATHLDPNAINYSGSQKPFWPMYNSASGFNAMNVNFTQIGVIRDRDASAQCDFFHGQSYVVRN